MSNYNYDVYIKNGCHPIGYNQPCESYVFGQSTVDMLLDKLAEQNAENQKLENIKDNAPNKEILESVKLELLEFVKRHNGIIYGMISEQVMAEQIEKCISEKIEMLGENK